MSFRELMITYGFELMTDNTCPVYIGHGMIARRTSREINGVRYLYSIQATVYDKPIPLTDIDALSEWMKKHCKKVENPDYSKPESKVHHPFQMEPKVKNRQQEYTSPSYHARRKLY